MKFTQTEWEMFSTCYPEMVADLNAIDGGDGVIKVSDDAMAEFGGADWLSAAEPIYRKNSTDTALLKIDIIHGDYLVTLTGGATVAERDTWKVKEEAARAFDAGAATSGQIAMLEAEASGAGIMKEVLAATILTKADRFLVLIGVAAGIRAESRAAVIAATDETVPLAEVSDRIDQVDAAMRTKAEAAAAAILAGN
jgi:hypothetical protein